MNKIVNKIKDYLESPLRSRALGGALLTGAVTASAIPIIIMVDSWVKLLSDKVLVRVYNDGVVGRYSLSDSIYIYLECVLLSFHY